MRGKKKPQPANVYPPPKTDLKHYYLKLPNPVNDFAFEGAFVLPPIKVEEPGGDWTKAIFMVGHRCGKKITILRTTAYGDLARLILAEYNQGDHVLVRGGFTTYWPRGGYCQSGMIVTSIERVEKAEKPMTSGRMLDELLGEGT